MCVFWRSTREVALSWGESDQTRRETVWLSSSSRSPLEKEEVEHVKSIHSFVAGSMGSSRCCWSFDVLAAGSVAGQSDWTCSATSEHLRPRYLER